MQTVAVTGGFRRERRARFVDFRRSGSPDLRERLVKRHLPIARRLAARFARRGIPFDDLYQVASVGLILAVDRFDPGRGVAFDDFAGPTIIGEIKHHFRDRGWDLHVPRRTQDLCLAANATIERLEARLRRTPSIEEIATALGVSPAAVARALEAGAAFNTDSLSDPREDRARRRRERLRVEDAALGEVDDRLLVADLVQRLPGRLQVVVRLHYWEGMTQGAIGRRLGMSQMQVSRLLRASLATLKEYAVDD